MTAKRADGENVGYGRPPQHTRFELGRSGNPKGRPKGSADLTAALIKTLEETVVVTENGRRRRMSKLAVAWKQLVNKAAAGDPKALQLLLQGLRMVNDAPLSESTATTVFANEDQFVIDHICARIRRTTKADNPDEPDQLP